MTSSSSSGSGKGFWAIDQASQKAVRQYVDASTGITRVDLERFDLETEYLAMTSASVSKKQVSVLVDGHASAYYKMAKCVYMFVCLFVCLFVCMFIFCFLFVFIQHVVD